MSSYRTLLIFPHQLFEAHPVLRSGVERVVLIEDNLFFGDLEYPAMFHKQKLWFHRATMKRYEQQLLEAGIQVDYLEHNPKKSVLEACLKKEKKNKTSKI